MAKSMSRGINHRHKMSKDALPKLLRGVALLRSTDTAALNWLRDTVFAALNWNPSGAFPVLANVKRLWTAIAKDRELAALCEWGFCATRDAFWFILPGILMGI